MIMKVHSGGTCSIKIKLLVVVVVASFPGLYILYFCGGPPRKIRRPIGLWWYQCCRFVVVLLQLIRLLLLMVLNMAVVHVTARMVIAGFRSGADTIFWLWCEGCGVKVVVPCAILSLLVKQLLCLLFVLNHAVIVSLLAFAVSVMSSFLFLHP